MALLRVLVRMKHTFEKHTFPALHVHANQVSPNRWLERCAEHMKLVMRQEHTHLNVWKYDLAKYTLALRFSRSLGGLADEDTSPHAQQAQRTRSQVRSQHVVHWIGVDLGDGHRADLIGNDYMRAERPTGDTC